MSRPTSRRCTWGSTGWSASALTWEGCGVNPPGGGIPAHQGHRSDAEQHAFTRGKLCLTSLGAYPGKRAVPVVYLGFQKAFDIISGLLITNLVKYRVNRCSTRGETGRTSTQTAVTCSTETTQDSYLQIKLSAYSASVPHGPQAIYLPGLAESGVWLSSFTPGISSLSVDGTYFISCLKHALCQLGSSFTGVSLCKGRLEHFPWALRKLF